MFELAAPAEINSLGFQSDNDDLPNSAQAVRVEISTQGPDSGYSSIGDYRLQETTREQDFPLSRPVTGRWLRVTLQQRGAEHTSIRRVMAFGRLQLSSASRPISGAWLVDTSVQSRDDKLFLGTQRLTDTPDPALLNNAYMMVQTVQEGSDFRATPCHSTGPIGTTMGGTVDGNRLTWIRNMGYQLEGGVINMEGNLIIGAKPSNDDPFILMRLPVGHDCSHVQPAVGSGQNVLVLSDDGTFRAYPPATKDDLAKYPGYRFTPMPMGVFTRDALTGMDTVVLAFLCDLGKKITPWQSQALLDFVAAGHKLIIHDADACTSTDYSFLPYQFHTSNPGGQGAPGHNLVLVEPSTLGNDAKDSAQYLDLVAWVSEPGNQIGDSNTVTTRDPHWCGHLFGTNALNVNGFMHMYAPFGQGLFIFDGFDADDHNRPTYQKVLWLELQQPVPALLSCAESVAAKFLIAPSKQVPYAAGRASQVHVPLMVLANQGYAGTVSLAPKAPADAPWKTQLSVQQVTLQGDTAPLTFTVEVPANASPGGHTFLVTGNDSQGNTASATIILFPSAAAEVAKVETVEKGCTRNLIVGSDALFAFNQATLTSTAQKTLASLGPEIKKARQHPIQINGYTDSIGSEKYNQLLREQRARSVRDWLVAHHYLAAGTPIQGLGKQNPIAPNTNPNGSDNPAGRAKNRRVEVAIDTCK